MWTWGVLRIMLVLYMKFVRKRDQKYFLWRSSGKLRNLELVIKVLGPSQETEVDQDLLFSLMCFEPKKNRKENKTRLNMKEKEHRCSLLLFFRLNFIVTNFPFRFCLFKYIKHSLFLCGILNMVVQRYDWISFLGLMFVLIRTVCNKNTRK